MGKDPNDVRQEIEETRARMDATVDELGNRADVKGRMSGYVSDKKDAVVGKVTGATSTAGDKLPDGGELASGGRRVVRTAQDNPLGLAIGGAAVGFLVGTLVPSTRMEDERMGTVADELKDRARETGQQALESGKQVAADATESAVETAKESAAGRSEELSSTLREQAGDMAPGGPRSQP